MIVFENNTVHTCLFIDIKICQCLVYYSLVIAII